MLGKLRENISVIIIFGLIVCIGIYTYMKDNNEKEILESPKIGDYYVFKGLLVADELVYKIKAIEKDTIEFLMPENKLVYGFRRNQSESIIKDADKKGDMYRDLTVLVSKDKIRKYRENAKSSKRNSQDDIILKYIFR